MTGAAVLLGVDIVERDRLGRMISDLGDAYRKQVVTQTERHRHREPIEAAAAFAIKECLIKAVGGRPDGFRWHDFEQACAEPPGATTLATVEGDDPTALLDEAAAALQAATGIELTTAAPYDVHGASRAAALARLAPGRPAQRVLGAARWGHNDIVIAALAVVWTKKEKGAPGCP
ncbi:4'-phosphopantetheinyl transferase superfamily protein [Actinoalloteichus hymeniacidonis]|uniref:4'-phosphopantetheinyl transferase superfamily protein n=1 Tax=Actinoalloteichus hymeniacidonis TaxID=340345 RepID=A0AAC9HMB3_9PSEU|nr:4'-phosphopantetheinyl transferase superfamily protein [Actinoalloteichus hymeniacidonis]AOS61972.1 4'-phosphopantetheinyl transferase superfamily protein [Actinoalloteichus hymeniacidonis]MBB5910006.1 holo-[acyl-carrier protein] synthase [Actinoalloteichus hymeniacidonis]